MVTQKQIKAVQRHLGQVLQIQCVREELRYMIENDLIPDSDEVWVDDFDVRVSVVVTAAKE